MTTATNLPSSDVAHAASSYDGQRRAKVGGEFGPNGEWYEGGKFIATTDRPKCAPIARPELTPEEIAARAAQAEANRIFLAERAVKLAAVAAQVADLATRMADGRGGFRDSIAKNLSAGVIPSGRGFTLMLEILAKQAGRSNSKAYNAAYDALFARLEPIAAQYEAIYK